LIGSHTDAPTPPTDSREIKPNQTAPNNVHDTTQREQVMDLECEGKSGVGLKELTWIHTHKTAALLKVRFFHPLCFSLCLVMTVDATPVPHCIIHNTHTRAPFSVLPSRPNQPTPIHV
jgi:hypothetical protein